MTITVLTAAGTWAAWDMGYPADVARALSSEWDGVMAELMGEAGPRFRWQGIGYPAVGFLNPDPMTSYNESVALGVTEGLRLIDVQIGGLDRFPIIYDVSQLGAVPFDSLVELDIDLVGYSQGAEVVIRIAIALLLRGLRPRRIVTIGSPCRPPGPTKVGNNPPGSGISRLYTPVPLRRITTDIVRDKGEMYGNAEEDTLLPEFYGLFTQAELSLPFGVALLRILGTALPLLGGIGGTGALNMFGGLFGGRTNTLPAVLGEVGVADQEVHVLKILGDLPGVMKTAVVLGDFLTTQAHTSYHLPAPEFGGRTGLQVAVQALAG